MTSVPAPSRCGEEIDGKYRLIERLGDGSTAVVYRAEHRYLRRPVAVKLLAAARPGAEAIARFQREAEALGRLRHPHIVGISDFGIDHERRPYLVMEYLAGSLLDVFIGESGPLPLARALPILEALAAALDHAHAQGVLHRDLKPGNVILGATPSSRVTVIDFGLARLDRAGGGCEAPRRDRRPTSGNLRRTQAGALVGTAAYIAPEIVQGGPATTASDVYSFAVLAYELLVGRLPFGGTTAQVLAGHLDGLPPDPHSLGVHLPAGAGAALLAALSKDAARRPPTAGRLVARLLRATERDRTYRSMPSERA